MNRIFVIVVFKRGAFKFATMDSSCIYDMTSSVFQSENQS